MSSRAVVLRTAGRALKAYPNTGKYYRAARIIQHVYRNRKRYGRAARTIYRAAKRRRRMQKVGEDIGSSNTKRCTTNIVEVRNFNSRFLNKYLINVIPKTTTNEIDKRQRDVVNLRGIKLQMEWRNNSNEPLQCHWCILCPKYRQGIENSEFFRGHDNVRAVDFANTQSSTQFWTRPINTDDYTIIAHKRFTLAPKDGGVAYNAEGPKNFRTVNRYIKIQRQCRYDGDELVNGRLWLCYWADKFMTPAGTAGATSAYGASHRILTYFKEPK